MRRVRIVEEPLTPYTEWELAAFEHITFRRLPRLRQNIRVVSPQDVAHLPIPAGDFNMYDEARVAAGTYDATGLATHITFCEEPTEVGPYVDLWNEVWKLSRPMDSIHIPSIADYPPAASLGT